MILDPTELEGGWNHAVLNPAPGPSAAALVDVANFTNLHYYAYQWFDQGPIPGAQSDEQAFPGIMSGSSLLVYAKHNLTSQLMHRIGRTLPMVVTEYNTITFQAYPTGGLDDNRVGTFTVGLNVGDFLLMMISRRFAGAHVFDLSQSLPNWGLIGTSYTGSATPGAPTESKWVVRPSGWAFALMSAFARTNDLLINSTALNPEVIPVWTSPPTKTGVIPPNYSYKTFDIVVSRVMSGGPVMMRVAAINRHLSQLQDGVITIAHLPPSYCTHSLANPNSYRVTVTTYASSQINATNDNPGPIPNPDPFTVSLKNLTVTVDHPFGFAVDPHTLVRYDILASCPPPPASSSSTAGGGGAGVVSSSTAGGAAGSVSSSTGGGGGGGGAISSSTAPNFEGSSTAAAAAAASSTGPESSGTGSVDVLSSTAASGGGGVASSSTGGSSSGTAGGADSRISFIVMFAFPLFVSVMQCVFPLV